MAKIAPTLQRHLDSYAPGSDGVAGWLPPARAELRALLAVARTAKRALAYSGIEDENDPVTGEPLNRQIVALLRAVSRLDRVSGRKGEGRP